jgi:hypothetical protein
VIHGEDASNEEPEEAALNDEQLQEHTGAINGAACAYEPSWIVYTECLDAPVTRACEGEAG